MASHQWKHRFTKTILNRGRDYYEEGNVYDLDFDDQSLTAVVCGSEDYEVEIHFAGTEIAAMLCDCPYAAEGNNCKHMAAVLFAWEDDDPTSVKEVFDDADDDSRAISSMTMEEAVNGLPEKTARELLLEYARTDSGLADRIRTIANGGVSQEQKSEWKRDLRKLQRRYHVNDYGEIFYQYIDPYFSELLALFYQRVEPLTISGFYDEAFERLCDLVEAASVDGRESSDDFSELMEECDSLLEQILQKADMETKRSVYRACLKRCGGQISADNSDLWQDCLLYRFSDEEFLRQNLCLIDEVLEGMTVASNENWLRCLVTYRTDTLKRLGEDRIVLTEYHRRFWKYAGIRRTVWEDALAHQDWTYAISLLRECEQMDSEQPYLLREYSQQLCDIFEKQNDLNALREELAELIFTYQYYDFVWIQKLKRVSTDKEWEAHLCRLLDALSMGSLRHSLLAEEGMYRELLSELETEPFLMGLQQYESLLKPYFGEEIRDVFFAYLRKEMKQAGNRETYVRLIQRLKKMMDYPDGEAMARTLADEWRITYKRKSALMEELKKEGF